MSFSVVSGLTQNIDLRRRKNMYKSYEMELAGRTLKVEIGRVGAQANGAALMHYGETVVLSVATASVFERVNPFTPKTCVQFVPDVFIC